MRTIRISLGFMMLGSVLLLAGCNDKASNPEQVREATAKATAELKDNTKAVAEGVRDGLRSGSKDSPLDLNTASKSQIASLPGMSDASADRIVANRPYSSTHELLDRKLVTRSEYDQISGKVMVK